MQKSIEQLEQIIRDYSTMLSQADDATFSDKPVPGKWSKKEVLGHLVDSAQNNIRRFIVARYEERPYIVYAQDDWVLAADYQNYPLQDLIDLWVLLNKHMVIVLKTIPPADSKKEVQTQETHSIEWLAQDYNVHVLHHLHQVLNLTPVAYP